MPTEAPPAQDDRLATVSHDLRGPLGTIAMGVAMLRRSLAARGPELADDLNVLLRMERACKRMEGMIDTLQGAPNPEVGSAVEGDDGEGTTPPITRPLVR